MPQPRLQRSVERHKQVRVARTLHDEARTADLVRQLAKIVALKVRIHLVPAAREPEARLVIAGGGPLRPDLERHARRLGLEGRVVFTGYVPEAEKAAHFRLADVFLFPSAMEGFGFSVAEAMSAGVPVVASDRGSIPELVAEGQSGFVCDPSVPDRFVERLLLLLGDPALREKFGAAARERADRLFRWDACVDGTRRVYEETLEAWRRRGGRPAP